MPHLALIMPATQKRTVALVPVTSKHFNPHNRVGI
jgi:hypothetical protein